jgi:hypothetical protein
MCHRADKGQSDPCPTGPSVPRRTGTASDGSLRASRYRDGQPVRQEWVGNPRHGRRRVIDLICTAIDTDNATDNEVTDSTGPDQSSAGGRPRNAEYAERFRCNHVGPLRQDTPIHPREQAARSSLPTPVMRRSLPRVVSCVSQSRVSRQIRQAAEVGTITTPALACAAAAYLDVTLVREHIVGASFWSDALIALIGRICPVDTTQA